MSDDLESLRMRREILHAYVTVLDRADELLHVCGSVTGGDAETRSAVQDAFELGPVAADAVLTLQIRRFTPTAIERVRQELTDVDRQLAEADLEA